jgi:hypothetical protein
MRCSSRRRATGPKSRERRPARTRLYDWRLACSTVHAAHSCRCAATSRRSAGGNSWSMNAHRARRTAAHRQTSSRPVIRGSGRSGEYNPFMCGGNAVVAAPVPTRDLSRCMTPVPQAVARSLPLSAPRWRRVAEAVCPNVAALSPDAWLSAEAGMADAWAGLSAERRAAVRRFVQVLPWLAVPVARTSFYGADAAVQRRVMVALSQSPLAAVRRGVLALRSLVHAGLYADDALVAVAVPVAPPSPRPTRLTLVP